MKRLTENALIPAPQRLPGFQGYQGGMDRSAGRLVGSSTWDTGEHAGFTRDQIADALSQLQGAGVQLESAQVYEVMVHA